MAKKLLFIHLRVSEDLKRTVEKKVAQLKKKTPWANISEASYIREAVIFFMAHEKCREGNSGGS